ncbi:MAG: hypothetical protein AABN95_10560 [Acidobacteriota bacterium]
MAKRALARKRIIASIADVNPSLNKNHTDGHLIIGSYVIRQRTRHQRAMSCSSAFLT